MYPPPSLPAFRHLGTTAPALTQVEQVCLLNNFLSLPKSLPLPRLILRLSSHMGRRGRRSNSQERGQGDFGKTVSRRNIIREYILNVRTPLCLGMTWLGMEKVNG